MYKPFDLVACTATLTLMMGLLMSRDLQRTIGNVDPNYDQSLVRNTLGICKAFSTQENEKLALQSYWTLQRLIEPNRTPTTASSAVSIPFVDGASLNQIQKILQRQKDGWPVVSNENSIGLSDGQAAIAGLSGLGGDVLELSLETVWPSSVVTMEPIYRHTGWPYELS
jgi:hypothetical protein